MRQAIFIKNKTKLLYLLRRNVYKYILVDRSLHLEIMTYYMYHFYDH